MEPSVTVTNEMVGSYINLFVNRLAYTVQSPTPDPESGKHYYYRALKDKKPISLSVATVRRHLQGAITIGLYAINPKTQRCKWVAIDADYSNALEDLLKLQWELRQDGVEAALEKSRRGGHLWIFNQEPLLARDCRIYIYNVALRLRVPLKGAKLAEGIEVFPKQDEIRSTEFGNALRAPLGIHRGVGRRFWFYGADYATQAQMDYLLRLRKTRPDEMARFVEGLTMPEEFAPKRDPEPIRYRFRSAQDRGEFRILDYVTVKRRNGRNYWTRCPSCAQAGRDTSSDNLAISIADGRKYRCWAGCTKEMIRAALGAPIRNRRVS
jgi:hypothetical protein